MFLQVSVILLTGGVRPKGMSAPRGSTHWRSGLGGVYSGRGRSGLGWGVPAPGGAWWRPHTPGMATSVGGTHPTGMHSCLHIKFRSKGHI